MEKTNMTLEQLQWLLERMITKHNPITRDDVRRFGRQPKGPIIPEACVSVERVPAYWGTRHDKYRGFDHGAFVHDLAVSPTGELWIATTVEGKSVVINHGDTQGRRTYADGRAVFELLEDEDEGRGTRFAPRILGFHADGAPISALRKSTSNSESRYWQEDVFLFVADARVFVGQLPVQRLLSVRVTSSGDIVTVHERDYEGSASKKEYTIFKNGERIRSVMAPPLYDAWVLDDSEVGIVLPNADVPGLYRSTPHAHYIIAAMPPNVLGAIVNVRGAAEHLKLMCTIATTANTVLHAQYHRSSHNPTISMLGACAYVAHDLPLPDGRWTYVGKTTRDHLQCMVVSGVPGPGFDLVSNAFVHDAQPYYYGVSGPHLLLMEIPPPQRD